jgi:hypothetical protein
MKARISDIAISFVGDTLRCRDLEYMQIIMESMLPS